MLQLPCQLRPIRRRRTHDTRHRGDRSIYQPSPEIHSAVSNVVNQLSHLDHRYQITDLCGYACRDRSATRVATRPGSRLWTVVLRARSESQPRQPQRSARRSGSGRALVDGVGDTAKKYKICKITVYYTLAVYIRSRIVTVQYAL